MKRHRATKETIAEARAYFADNPSATKAEICEKFGVSISAFYGLQRTTIPPDRIGQLRALVKEFGGFDNLRKALDALEILESL